LRRIGNAVHDQAAGMRLMMVLVVLLMFAVTLSSP
jgi:hypothetical protein